MPANQQPELFPSNIYLMIDRNLIPIEYPVTNLGRHINNTVIISDPHTSRYHARILFKEGVFWVVDLDSSVGTLVNGQLVEGEVMLHSGDTLTVGSTPVVFIDQNTGKADHTTAATGMLDE